LQRQMYIKKILRCHLVSANSNANENECQLCLYEILFSFRIGLGYGLDWKIQWACWGVACMIAGLNSVFMACLSPIKIL
jgi:hypothetical protein